MTNKKLAKEIRKMINASFEETDKLVESFESKDNELPIRVAFEKKHNQLIGYQAALLSVLDLI